jgi:hypothetical protein
VFTLDRAQVVEIGWLAWDGCEALYVISRSFLGEVQIAVFTYVQSTARYNLLSEQSDDHMGDCMFIPNLPGFGPTFVLIKPQFVDNPDRLPEAFMLKFVTHGELGFFVTHDLMLGDLISRGELAQAETMEDLKALIEVTLKTTS